ncbi:unnamed protein product [Rangifer tarandus platyrhynchus]|uniref:Uncharacterized protein n=1 Tax=Rangifer tarandus platyrhynchus TaxID=3082113 RepID=A0AC59ZNB6_RANTA
MASLSESWSSCWGRDGLAQGLVTPLEMRPARLSASYPSGDETGSSKGWSPCWRRDQRVRGRVTPLEVCSFPLSFHHLLQTENCNRKERSTAGAGLRSLGDLL